MAESVSENRLRAHALSFVTLVEQLIAERDILVRHVRELEVELARARGGAAVTALPAQGREVTHTAATAVAAAPGKSRKQCSACSWCDTGAVNGSMCGRHYQRKFQHGDPLLKKIKVDGKFTMFREVGPERYEPVAG
jgi:hypothetical protein